MSDDQSKELTAAPCPLPEPDDFGKPEQQRQRLTSKRQSARRAAVDRRARDVHGAARQHARASAAEILGSWVGLSVSERRQIVTAFRSVMIPKRRAGRKPSETLTAAYTDWKSDIRGVALFQKHIVNWGRLSRWRRKTEQRSLMDAIYTRNRRERGKSSTTESPGDLTP
jgi:hypothetical protein